LGIVFIATGLILLWGGAAYSLGYDMPSFGEILTATFPWTWPYLPAFFFIAAALLLRKDFRRDLTLSLGLSVLPFISLTFWLRFCLEPEAAMSNFPLLARIGSVSVALLLAVLTAGLALVAIMLPRAIYTKEVEDKREKDPPPEKILAPRLLERLPRKEEAADGQPFSFQVPALPEPIELKSKRRMAGENRIPAENEARDLTAGSGEEFKINARKDAEKATMEQPLEVKAAAVGGEPGTDGLGAALDEIDLMESAARDSFSFSEETIPPAEDSLAENGITAAPEKQPEASYEEYIPKKEERVAFDPIPRRAPLPIEDVLADDGIPEIISIKPQETPITPLPDAAGEKKTFARFIRKIPPYAVPVEGILTQYPDGQYWIIDDETKRQAQVLKETLEEFNVQAEVTGIRKGPVITMYEILPAAGVKLSKIVSLQDNIALRMAAQSLRIVAPIPGKHAVGIEVPNHTRSVVSFREMIESESFNQKKMEIPVVLGKDIQGEVQIVDLISTPHLLIAGATGAGKSVCVNSLILSILYKRTPEEVKMIMIDPKIVELKLYNDIPHLLTPVITEPKKAFQALQYCLCEMERRYSLLDGMGVRDIKSYNKRIKERNIATTKLPYIVVFIDEFADLMATTGKELESTVARLAAMSRAVGIHLVLATQRPSIDVITGLIKANFPARIAFMVASKTDSRIIIDMVGAEKLLGRGDMLYASATDPFPVRIQGSYVSEEEVERVVEHVKTLGEPEYIDDEIFIDEEEEESEPGLFADSGDDPLMDKALEIVLQAGKASASYIQRRLKIGYNRAARLVELMEERGIVGPQQGSKPREIVHVPDRPRLAARAPNPYGNEIEEDEDE
jgi:S-DNA-T family DNA segregation ATPase FtsK/SpoIIIE